MRILFSTWPAHGHLLPLLPLARAAERAGHDVVVASGVEGAAEAARRGLTTWDVGPSRDEANGAFRRAVPDLAAVAPERRMATVVAGMFGAAAFERAERLVPRALEWQPDLVVHPITELAGAVAAARTGRPPRRARAGAAPGRGVDLVRCPLRRPVPSMGRADLAAAILDVAYLDTCPPSLQPTPSPPSATGCRCARRPARSSTGERLPWDDDRLARPAVSSAPSTSRSGPCSTG